MTHEEKIEQLLYTVGLYTSRFNLLFADFQFFKPLFF